MGWERSPVALRMSERIRADPLDTDAWRILLAGLRTREDLEPVSTKLDGAHSALR